VTDYAEIRGAPADPFFALRAWCRGEQAGIAQAAISDAVAVETEAQLLFAFAALGVGPREAEVIFDVALTDVRIHAPELDGVQRRAVAARLVLLHLGRWLDRQRGSNLEAA
jgi:hypothetical protein